MTSGSQEDGKSLNGCTFSPDNKWGNDGPTKKIFFYTFKFKPRHWSVDVYFVFLVSSCQTRGKSLQDAVNSLQQFNKLIDKLMNWISETELAMIIMESEVEKLNSGSLAARADDPHVEQRRIMCSKNIRVRILHFVLKSAQKPLFMRSKCCLTAPVAILMCLVCDHWHWNNWIYSLTYTLLF